MSAPNGISLALDDPWNEPDPTWTRIDTLTNVSVQSWSIDRGRNSENNVANAGTGTITFKDTNGVLDPTNSSGPYFGKLDPTKQAAIALRNPVDLSWSTLFRGFVTEWLYEMDVSETFATVTLELVDGLEILSALAMTAGNQGDTPPTGSTGDIYFLGAANGYSAGGFKHVNQRIIQALADAGWDTSMQVVFSGNVTLYEQVYARLDQLMQVIQDSADAEFPNGVSAVYMSKEGIFTFHGRYARFDPTRPGYGISTWKAGDLTAAAGDSDVVPISGLSFRRSRDDLFNAAVALPAGVSDTDVPGALVSDATSITEHGWRMKTFSDLLTYQGHDDVGDPTTALVETKKFATWLVDNFKNPKTRVQSIGFAPRGPGSLNATALWELMCGVEINDLIENLTTTHPGGGGFDEAFFVDGIHYTAQPGIPYTHAATTSYPEVRLSLDVTPASYYGVNPFPPNPDNDDMAGAFVLPNSVLSDTTAGNSVGFSNEGDDPVAATSKDPIVQLTTALFTGPGGDYGDEGPDVHNFYTAWWKWTAPGDWDSGSSFGVALSGQTAVSCLLLVKCGVSGVPPDNGDFTALGTAGALNAPGDKTTLSQTETGTANITAGDDVFIGVGSMELGGEDFDLSWTYTP